MFKELNKIIHELIMNFNLKENKYDKYWYRFLINKLKGNIDLAKMIIDIKNKNIIKTIKNEYIERDFYNWLNWDLIMRLKPNEEFIQYYNKNSSELGINLYDKNDCLRRIKSLKECFISKWWKTTEKSMGNWNNIHEVIKIKKQYNIYIWNLMRDYEIYDIDNININDWRISNNVEKYKIYDIHYELFSSFDIFNILDYNQNIYLSKDYCIIL